MKGAPGRAATYTLTPKRSFWGHLWFEACALPAGRPRRAALEWVAAGLVPVLEVGAGFVAGTVAPPGQRRIQAGFAAPPLPLEHLHAVFTVPGRRCGPDALRGPGREAACRNLFFALKGGLLPLDEEGAHLKPLCSCGALSLPCEHCAAVAEAFARAIDNDPFWLLAFRFAGFDPQNPWGGVPRRAARPSAPAAGLPPGAALPPETGPTLAAVWGEAPPAASASWTEGLQAPPSDVLARVRVPEGWTAEDPDLSAVMAQLRAALANVADDRDIAADIAEAYGAEAAAASARTPVPAPARAHPAPVSAPTPAAGPASAAPVPVGPAPAAAAAAPAPTPIPTRPRAGAPTAPPDPCCPSCGAPRQAQWRFCWRCGHRLPPSGK